MAEREVETSGKPVKVAFGDMAENAVGVGPDGEDGGFSRENRQGIDEIPLMAVIQHILLQGLVDLEKGRRATRGRRDQAQSEMAMTERKA